jgi:hypothetical protein
MDNHEIALEQQGGKVGIEMYLEPALEATETIFAGKTGSLRTSAKSSQDIPRIAALRFEWIYRGHRVSSINSSR